MPANETFQLPGQTDALTEDKQSDEEELSSMSSMHAEKMLQGIRAMKTSSPPPPPQCIDRSTNTSEHLLEAYFQKLLPSKMTIPKPVKNTVSLSQITEEPDTDYH